jgi:hypothetical protein
MFNNGWGDNFELRRFEQELLDQYLRSWQHDTRRSIVVNSTWYNRDFHAEVMRYAQENAVTRVALVSFMDPAILRESWFDDLDAEICAIGYYQGPHELDVWSLIVDRYFDPPRRLTPEPNLTTAFLCLNRKPHWHRRRLVSRLEHLGLIHHGVVTLGSDSGQPVLAMPTDVEPTQIAPNPGPEQYGIINDIMSLGPMEVWNRCFLNVVTETVFDVDQEWFVSEKIYKPVIGLRPFLVYAPNGAGRWLQHLGMETYCDDFRDITDLDLGEPDNIPPFLAVLAAQGSQYWQHKYQCLKPKMQHNLQAFQNHIQHTWQRVGLGI